ncbi:phage tail tape measure protein [Bradyrhizobium zhanjiangense]|uniref:Phage tail tape measure protein n=1 Tax=Bradyrhizobium zhanjiangense TaxID=1325107 RepID=A0ABY0DJT4_9BRAD|nr:phage tail tape measure protein [Bradyrhizobium zhanjiangense]RXG93035.1 phage tail tape measure protein [Bradyrhizobium zhanjiangense]
MAAIDRFGAAKGGFADARNKFREAQIGVDAAAKAMKRGEGDAAALARSYEKAQQAASRTAAALDKQRGAFINAKRGLEEFGVPINHAVAQQEKLRVAIERTSAALDRQAAKSERSARRREMLGTATGLAGGFLAHQVKHGAGEVIRTYREFDKERRFAKAVMGLTDDEQAPLVAQAIHMGARTKYNDVQVLEAQRELAARGLNKNQVMGMMDPAAQLGMSLDLSLPDAARQMEGAIFGFKKDTSTLEAARAAAKQTADYQVKAAKLSGMTPEDLRQLYKFGATPARMGKISEASLLGFGGVLKKANIGGDEAGVAFRALMATAQAPTAGAKTALLANGLNYKNYQRVPDQLAVDPFAEDVAARYGVKLNKDTRAGLAKIFSNKDLISDPAKFNPAVTALLRDQLEGNDAKSLKSIAGAAGRYRDKSVNDVDTNAFIKDLLPKLANNLPLANALFGSKQGGRIATALGDSDTLKHIISEIEQHSEGYSEKIAGERMSGFDGAVSRLEGAMKNLETSIGRAFDADGKGGALTWATDLAGRAVQGTAELPPWAIGAGSAAAAGGGLYGAYKFGQTILGGFGLSSSAVALDGSAAALSAAAAELSAAAGLKTAPNILREAAPSAAPGGAYALWTLGAAALPWAYAGAVTAGGLYAMHKSVEDAGYSGLTSGQRLALQRRGSMRDLYRREWGYGDNSIAPELSPTMTYGTGVSGDKAGPQHVDVSGQVNGEAKMALEVNAGSSLLDVVRRAEAAIRLSGTINSSGPGSLGHSSPDAAAPAPRPSTGSSGDASGSW